MAQTIQLVGNINIQTGRAGDAGENIFLTLAALTCTVVEGPIQLSLASGANAQTLPIATVQYIYLKNSHATQTIAVTLTPTGGASAIVNTLRPGDYIIISASAGAGSGFTALSLNASGAATTGEMILGG